MQTNNKRFQSAERMKPTVVFLILYRFFPTQMVDFIWFNNYLKLPLVWQNKYRYVDKL